MSHEVAVQALEFALVGDLRAAAQPFFQCGGEVGVRVNLAEHVVDGAAGERRGDAGGLDAPGDAQAAARAQAGFGAGDRPGRAGVVEAAVGLQACDGGVDRVRLVAAAGETLPDLPLRQLAPGQQPQPRDVGVVGGGRGPTLRSG